MRFRAYSKPHRVGWLGWFEDNDNNLIGFLGLDNKFVWYNAFN